MDRRAAPRIGWTQIAIGTLLALLLGLIAGDAPGLTLLGVSTGAFVAARLAATAGMLHGALTAGLWIVASTLLLPERQPADLIALIGYDLAHLAAGAVAGWLAVRQ
jgi:hypothetical protein